VEDVTLTEAQRALLARVKDTPGVKGAVDNATWGNMVDLGDLGLIHFAYPPGEYRSVNPGFVWEITRKGRAVLEETL
jgi:hypothetical protein